MKRDLMRVLRKFVPRADRQAIVAAIDAVSDRFAEFTRDRALVLDGQIGNAAPRIDSVRCEECMGRANVETTRAAAAIVAFGFIGIEFQRGEDRSEKQPRAKFAAPFLPSK